MMCSIPAANWVLALHDAKDEIETMICIKLGCAGIAAFQSRVAEPFYSLLKEKLLYQDIVSNFSIFYPPKWPNPQQEDEYGEGSIKPLTQRYRRELSAKMIVGDEFVMPAILSSSSSDVLTEWKTFRR